MFDVCSKNSYKHVGDWYRDIQRICKNIPVVLCGNKVDKQERAVKPKSVSFHKSKDLSYILFKKENPFSFYSYFL